MEVEEARRIHLEDKLYYKTFFLNFLKKNPTFFFELTLMPRRKSNSSQLRKNYLTLRKSNLNKSLIKIQVFNILQITLNANIVKSLADDKTHHFHY